MAETETNQKLMLKTSFKSVKTIESIYTGGKVVITADDSLLITTVNEDIAVTELATGQQKHVLEGDTEIVTTLAVKPDGKHLVSASRSLQMRIWDLEQGTCIRNFKAHDAPVIVMDIDPTSTLVATGGADSFVKVWDIDRGYCTHVFTGHHGVISAIKFLQVGQEWYLATGADDCEIRVWDLQTRKCIAHLKSHVSVIRGLDFSEDTNMLISGSRDKVVNVWDWRNGKLLATHPIYETLESVGFVSTGQFYTGGSNGTVRLWDLKSGKMAVEQKREENSKHEIIDVLYSQHSETLTAVTTDQNILVYSIEQGLKRIKQIVGYNDQIVDLMYLGEEETHIAAAANSENIRIYNIETQDCDLIYGHKDMVMGMARSRDSTLLATASKDRTVRLWRVDLEAQDAEDRYKCVAVGVGHTESVNAVGLSRKSNSFLISGGQDRTIKYWPIKLKPNQEQQQLHALYTHQAHEKDINTIAVAPNDKVFATGSQDKTAKVWNTDSGELMGTCKGHKRGIWCVQFSPVDQVLATSSGDKTIKLWNLRDFTCVKTFEGHTNTVLRVDFLTFGLQLVSGGSDGLVKVWTIKTNECAATLDNHTEKVWALAVRNDQKYIASGGADSIVNFWEDVTREEQEEELKEKEEMILKEQELQSYMLRKDYLNAILLALSLEQPYRLLTLFRDVMESGEGGITGSAAVDKALTELGSENLEKLLRYLRDWNTNGKHSAVAQTVLNAILSQRTCEELVELQGVKDIIEGLLPYTDRHYQRIDDLITQSYIVDYTLLAQKE
ncbi:WD40-repeat-containing domain protein [Syncephalastrum racemosum]|uniref:WD40-repeat-containing domain protein n=1 Tax=Syncephalastrum racemosum TaxID=13706 RepID=A0A1X2HUK0_SYNRA|nr:WD40-repeat-containing domain protein [Syncephalastrum racemosum]